MKILNSILNCCCCKKPDSVDTDTDTDTKVQAATRLTPCTSHSPIQTPPSSPQAGWNKVIQMAEKYPIEDIEPLGNPLTGQRTYLESIVVRTEAFVNQ